MGVPTSYYATVQARVDVEVVDDPDAKADLLTRQLAHFEPAGSVRQPVSTLGGERPSPAVRASAGCG